MTCGFPIFGSVGMEREDGDVFLKFRLREQVGEHTMVDGLTLRPKQGPIDCVMRHCMAKTKASCVFALVNKSEIDCVANVFQQVTEAKAGDSTDEFTIERSPGDSGNS